MAREQLLIETVFPTAGEPKFTYRSRPDLEDKLREFAQAGTGVLLVHGPTKAGKTVLIGRVVENAVIVRGDLGSANDLWLAVATKLGLFTGRAAGESSEDSARLTLGARIDAVLAGIRGEVHYEGRTGKSMTATAVDDPRIVVHDAIIGRGRTLVIEDFHFLTRVEQQKVMATVKGIADSGGRVIIVTAGHRARFVGTLIPNLGGRIEELPVNLWVEDDLKAIARLGFEKLNLHDPDESLASELASQSFGSPQLMQRLCAAIARANGVHRRRIRVARRTTDLAQADGWPLLRTERRLEVTEKTKVLDRVDNWAAFYRARLSPVALEVQWVRCLTRGPQERRPRTQYPTVGHGAVDGYGLIMLALRDLLPSMEISREQIHAKIESFVMAPGPRRGETTSKLSYLSKLAASPLDLRLDEKQLDDRAEDLNGADSDPVLEYQESGPISVLRIVDPQFAFALRWWTD